MTFAPLAKPSTPFTVVGTSTVIVWPASGSLVIVRVLNAMEVSAATRDTGPSRLTSCVT